MLTALVLLALPLAQPARAQQPDPLTVQAANAIISTPQPGATVRGTVTIAAKALPAEGGAGFEYWKLEFGPGYVPVQWALIGEQHFEPSDPGNSDLVRWDTTGLPNGPYTLRLVVVDRTGNFTQSRQVVLVDNPGARPLTPAEIGPAWSTPAAGATVSGRIELRGSVALPGVQGYMVQAGPSAGELRVIVPFTTSIPEGGSGTLGIWDTTGWANGTYLLVLTVQDNRGQWVQVPRYVTVRN